jgi:hypothetical protein
MGLFGCMHDWYPLGGAINVGNGKFKKNFKCRKCGKVKEVIS